MVLITKKNWGGGWWWGGWITASSTDTLTNKTLDDYTNFIHADWVHLRVKAIEPLSKWDVIKFVWFNNGEQAIEVAKRDSTSVPAIWVVYTPMDTWDFGMAVSNWLFKWIDTSTFTEWTVLYPNTSGWFTATNPWWYAQQLAYVVRSHAVNWEIMVTVWDRYNTADSMWVQYLWWSIEIPVLEKRSWRIKKDWRIIAYSIDSYDENWDPLVWDFNIFIYINDVLIWNAWMYWLDTIYNTDLTSRSETNINYNDKITYMVEDNEWCKNIVLTLYYI